MRTALRSATGAVAAALAATMLAACGGQPDSASQAQELEGEEFDWQRFSGTELSVYIPDTGQVPLLTERLPEFEEMTGIDVTIESSDVNSYRSNLPVRLTSRTAEYDVIATFPEVDGPQFAANDWYMDLGPYLSSEALTDPDYDFADFRPGVQEAMTVDGRTVTVLWEMQTDLMYYRKDLLEEAGLEVPSTFAEWEEAAAAIHDPESDLYGFALRGIPYQTTTPFSSFLFAHCGQWVDGDQVVIDSPEALEAWETYGRWGSQYGPPGIVSFDWPVPAQQFAQGNVFAFLDINLFVPELEDESTSRVAGNVGYALVPEGPCGRAPFIGGWGYAVSPFSENPDAAWYFIQWATGKAINQEMKLTGWPSPRASAWESEEFQANDPTPEFTEVVLESIEIANAQMNPPISPGVEAREIAGVVGNTALSGVSDAELEEVAERQAAELQELLESAP